MSKKPDFVVAGEGTVYLLTPLTKAARQWRKLYLPKDAQTLGSSLAVEHRYISAIVHGIRTDGLTVERV